MPWTRNDRAWGDMTFNDRNRQRLLSYCVLPHGLLGCWAWRGDLVSPGRFLLASQEVGQGRLWTPARASFKLFVEDPGDFDILHSCDNRGCSNSLHCRKSRDLANIKDRNERGRSRGRWSKTAPVTHHPWSDLDFVSRYLSHPSQIAALITAIRQIATDLPCNSVTTEQLQERVAGQDG